MAPVRGWKVFYADRTYLTSKEYDWLEIPRENCIGVVEYLEPPYRRIIDGGDWYWMERGQWCKSGTMWGGWVNRPHSNAIRGIGLPDKEYKAISQRMWSDRTWV